MHYNAGGLQQLEIKKVERHQGRFAVYKVDNQRLLCSWHWQYSTEG